jgi:hypothetical protein
VSYPPDLLETESFLDRAEEPFMTRTHTFTWPEEITGTPNGDAPSILDASFNYKAEVEIPEGGAEGMIVTQGGRFAGYGFYLSRCSFITSSISSARVGKVRRR